MRRRFAQKVSAPWLNDGVTILITAARAAKEHSAVITPNKLPARASATGEAMWTTIATTTIRKAFSTITTARAFADKTTAGGDRATKSGEIARVNADGGAATGIVTKKTAI